MSLKIHILDRSEIMENSKVRIAYFVHGLSGGVGSVLINYIDMLPKSRYEFDVITLYIESDDLYRKFTSRGINVIKIPSKSESIIKNIYSMYRILGKKKYDIAHAHMTLTNCFPLFIAWTRGIKIRVSHSHLAEKSTLYTNILACLTRIVANVYLACGKSAGRFLYGNRRFEILNNAVDLKKYRYNIKMREAQRKLLGIKDSTILFGNVGRFSKQKNHTFLIDIFKEIHSKNKDTKLILIGDGELEEEIKNKIVENKLEQAVIFTGAITNVYEVMQAIDILIMPSLFEGLSIAAIEAQANGIKCVFSDTVDSDTKVIDDVKFLSLNDSVEKWANTALELAKYPKKDESKIISERGYDLSKEGKKLGEIYQRELSKLLREK